MIRSQKPSKFLTREDSEIWRRITRTAKPLLSNKKNFADLLFNQPKAETPAAPRKIEMLRDGTAPVYQTDTPLKPAFSANLLDIKTTRKISKGKITIDGRIDLHGLIQHDAHARLYDYLENSYHTGKRIILVITGKGNLGHGILRENVPLWLSQAAFRPFVSAYSESHTPHGGSGALYVRLRRKPLAK